VVTLFPQAACRGKDPNLWFPEQGTPAGEAKTICHTCPAQEECLDYALAHPWLQGIWGGLNAKERRRLRHSSGLLGLRF
jgi:WhiB family redox-sensing transcriptional regulator